MSWIRVDDRAVWHRKLIDVGPMAGWLWLCGLSYANQQDAHDGFIPDGAVDFMPMKNPAKYAPDLVRVGLWERADGGYVVHDYHDFQPTKEEVDDLRATRSEAGRAGGRRSGEARRKHAVEANVKQLASQSGSKREANVKQASEANANPVPSHPDPDPDRRETSPGSREECVRRDMLITEELRAIAQQATVQDIESSWRAYCGKRDGRVLNVAGDWQGWCVAWAKNERRDRDRDRGTGGAGRYKQPPSDWDAGEKTRKAEEI